jgi:hypothetical protein
VHGHTTSHEQVSKYVPLRLQAIVSLLFDANDRPDDSPSRRSAESNRKRQVGRVAGAAF